MGTFGRKKTSSIERFKDGRRIYMTWNRVRQESKEVNSRSGTALNVCVVWRYPLQTFFDNFSSRVMALDLTTRCPRATCQTRHMSKGLTPYQVTQIHDLKRYKMELNSEITPLTRSYTEQSKDILHTRTPVSICILERNSFEDHSEHPCAGKYFQVRYLMAVLSFLGLCNVFGMRINLSVAIVQMVQERYIVEKNGTAEEYAVFDWSTAEQGRLLSSFFWGYIITQLPGGVMSGKIGGKGVFGLGILSTAIFTLLTPLVATYGGLNWLMFMRFMEGMGEGVTYPALLQFWSKWAPEMERTQLVAISLNGAFGGTVLAMPTSGLLAQHFGWESIFYVYGGFSCLWFLIWHFAAAETPELHSFISIEEQLYIERTRTANGHCIISPTIVGLLTSEQTLEEWRIVFYISGAVYAVGGTIFLIFASATKHPEIRNQFRKALLCVVDCSF
ncbi:Vesicular glutamate transporter 3 [Nymphon striatum]|nr:Vesicular glutamate transporter 3 [Nymphon striatum]